jgi:PIN domain nuclease of toxin-antitoxin system
VSGILLDTHILLWWLADDRKLPASFRRVIADRNNACFVSAATVWEIGIKRALGKLDGRFEDYDFELVSADHGSAP